MDGEPDNTFARMLKDEMENAGLSLPTKSLFHQKVSVASSSNPSTILCPFSKLNVTEDESSASILRRALKAPVETRLGASSGSLPPTSTPSKLLSPLVISSLESGLPPLKRFTIPRTSTDTDAPAATNVIRTSLPPAGLTATQGIVKNKSAFKAAISPTEKEREKRDVGKKKPIESPTNHDLQEGNQKNYLPPPKGDVAHILRAIAGASKSQPATQKQNQDTTASEELLPSENETGSPLQLQNIAFLPPSQLFAKWCAENINSPFNVRTGSSSSPTADNSTGTSRQSRKMIHPAIETSLSSRSAAIALHHTVEERLAELFAGLDADTWDERPSNLEGDNQLVASGATAVSSSTSPFIYPNTKPNPQRISRADRARRIRRVYDDAAYEIIRQISLHCAERARLLAYVWVSSSDALANLSEKFDLQDEMHKKEIKKLQLALARANDSYETLSKFVCDSANEEGLARMAVMDRYFALEKKAQEAAVAHRTELLHSKAAVAQLLDENKNLKAKLLRRRDFLRADGGFVFLKSEDGTRIVRRRKNELKKKGIYDDDEDVKLTRANIAAVPRLNLLLLANFNATETKADGKGGVKDAPNEVSASSQEIFHEPERRRERSPAVGESAMGSTVEKTEETNESATVTTTKPTTLMDVIGSVFGSGGKDVTKKDLISGFTADEQPGIVDPSLNIIQAEKQTDDHSSDWSGDLRTPRDEMASRDRHYTSYGKLDPTLDFDEIEAADEAEDIIQTQLSEIFRLRLKIVDLTHEIEKLRDHDQVSVFRHQGVNTNIMETRDIGITANPSMAVGGGGGVRRHRK